MIALVAAALSFTAAGGGAGQPEPSSSQLAASYVEAFNANDAKRLAALFAEDAVLMPPETPAIKGRAAVEAAYRARFAQLRLGQLQMQTLDFESHGERATAVGTFSLSIGDPSSAAATGKFIVIYKRVKNTWLIAYQIMNYDSQSRR